MTSRSREPLLAIVGRPNVGKSTLFNRLIARRRAITDATAGVTRDPVAATATIAGVPVTVVDTGGYTLDRDELATAVTGRALRQVADADVVVLVVDGTEITAMDEELIEALRPHSAKIILAVNKIDSRERSALVWDLYRFGLEPVVGISAAHGLGIGELEEAVQERLAAMAPAEPPDAAAPEAMPVDAAPGEGAGTGPLRLAIMGQPNTGKSTLVNLLVGEETSIVSPEPGTTRDVVEGRFSRNGTDFIILDTAGIRRKSKVSEDLEYYSVNRAIATVEESEVVVLMVDAEKGLADQDKKIASRIVDRGRGVVLALSKWDLGPAIPNRFNAVRDRILFLFPVIAFAPIVPLSAKDGTGVERLLREVIQVRSQLHRRVETGVLNRSVQAWVEATPPPVRSGRRLKVRYATQVGRLPVTFVLFVSHARGFPESYVQYIKNRIRSEFAIDKIPIRMEIRER